MDLNSKTYDQLKKRMERLDAIRRQLNENSSSLKRELETDFKRTCKESEFTQELDSVRFTVRSLTAYRKSLMPDKSPTATHELQRVIEQIEANRSYMIDLEGKIVREHEQREHAYRMKLLDLKQRFGIQIAAVMQMQIDLQKEMYNRNDEECVYEEIS